MDEYLKIEFEFLSEQQKETAIALLSEMNYEGFEEEGDLLKAYVLSSLFNENELKQLIAAKDLFCTITRMENRNWNQLWESNFHPVIINHLISGRAWVGIRAEFHKIMSGVEFEIIITPKMSFGTGHHATTSMMIQMMGQLDFKGKSVLDFGTGTGVLAILAEKLGASKIVGIDNDSQSIDNASENFVSNNCKNIQLIHASSPERIGRYDIILANITRSVIVENLHAFGDQLTERGVLLLSGILLEDEGAIVKSAEKTRLIADKKMAVDQWLALRMTYAHNMI
ncbi:MAG TPA: 50S ribosomal protein L11 methyltransferase [Chitinophagaceae bacterium]|nr:50S ribosomal protein L11 methyltransferase [Chitinophagaceae bacterium]